MEADSEKDFQDIPVIDVSALVDESLADDDARVVETSKQIHKACRDVGFFYISEHSVSEELQDSLFLLSQRFFSLPLEEKLKIEMKHAGRNWRGFFPVGGELTSGRPDRKEGIYFGVEHADDHPLVLSPTPMHGKNQWPDQVPEMKQVVIDYMAAVTSLGHRLMRGVAIGLGLPPRYFLDRFTDDPTILFRVFNYPFHTWASEEDEWGVRQHTDMGFLTILKQDESGGLEVRNRSGQWIQAPPKKGTFVVNIGDMLEIWTHGLYSATLHRVRNKGSSDRLSFPLFFDPNWLASLQAIPADLLDQNELQTVRSRSSSNFSRWDGLDLDSVKGSTYGDFVWAKISRVFPSLAQIPPN